MHTAGQLLQRAHQSRAESRHDSLRETVDDDGGFGFVDEVELFGEEMPGADAGGGAHNGANRSAGEGRAGVERPAGEVSACGGPDGGERDAEERVLEVAPEIFHGAV